MFSSRDLKPPLDTPSNARRGHDRPRPVIEPEALLIVEPLTVQIFSMSPTLPLFSRPALGTALQTKTYRDGPGKPVLFGAN